MSTRYVPLLRWKRAEKNALKQLSEQGGQNIAPLFLLGADQFKPTKATKSKPSIPASDHFAKEIEEYWGGNPFFLDASAVDAMGNQSVAEIASKCRERKLRPIFVLKTDVSNRYVDDVRKIVALDGHGVCLRLGLQEMSDIPEWIDSWPFPVEQTDLIIDFLNRSELVWGLGESVLKSSFSALHKPHAWRSVTTVGTSIPDNFMGLKKGLYTISRNEQKIWKVAVSAIPRSVDYGDYATVSLAAPAPGIAWGYPITVKYTLPGEFLIFRGVNTKGQGAVDLSPQLLEHAKSIYAVPKRNRLADCWADKEIDAIALGYTGPKTLENWTLIGINRHIEIVRSALP